MSLSIPGHQATPSFPGGEHGTEESTCSTRVLVPATRWPGPGRLDQTFAEGQAGQAGAAAAAGLVPDPVQVRARCADADVQPGGDPGVGAAPGRPG